MPTYFFVTMITLTIVTGVVREVVRGPTGGTTPHHIAGAVPVHQGNGLVMGATILILLRAFANGGSSLTGVEAISNTVTVFRKPQGVNARRVLTAMACILGFLLAGVATWPHVTHATPYVAGYPSCSPEIARAVFGQGRSATSCTSSSRRQPLRSCSPAPTPVSTGSRRWPVSSPRIASCRDS